MFVHLLILSFLLPYILLCNNPNLNFGNYFKKPDCGGYGSGLDNGQGRSNRVWTLSSYDLWPNKVVYYSYISDDSDDLRNDAVYIDKTVGINKALMNIKRNVMLIFIISFLPCFNYKYQISICYLLSLAIMISYLLLGGRWIKLRRLHA